MKFFDDVFIPSKLIAALASAAVTSPLTKISSGGFAFKMGDDGGEQDNAF